MLKVIYAEENLKQRFPPAEGKKIKIFAKRRSKGWGCKGETTPKALFGFRFAKSKPWFPLNMTVDKYDG
jgi:hypothetical protein